jgi:hypothetical protein
MAQLPPRLLDLPQHRFTLRRVHLRHRRAGQPALRPVDNRDDHLQIA